MSILGTGTKEDPYIVSTWEEIVSQCGIADVYVKCIPNLEINMNTSYRFGATSITLNCAEWDGNGVIIKNGYWHNTPIFTMTIATNITKVIKNISFLNTYTDTSLFQMKGNYAMLLHLINITITGFHTGSDAMFRINAKQGNVPTLLEGCSFNLNNPNGAVADSYYSDYHPTFDNCFIKWNGTHFGDASNSGSGAPILKSSRIDGKIGDSSNSTYLYFSCSNSIINASGAQISWTGNNAGTSHVIYNSDLISSGSSQQGGVTGLTTEQLKDASTVAATGFPIYVEE